MIGGGRGGPRWGPVVCLVGAAVAACADREPLPVAAVDAGTPMDAAADSPAAADVGPTLAADVAERERRAQAKYGATARVRTVRGTFVLVEAGGPSPLFDQAGALLERALASLLDGRFTTPLPAGVTVLLFRTAAAFEAYHREQVTDAAVGWGVYRRRTREIAVDLSGGAAFLPTLTHEVVHPLVQADFPDAPLWLEEGIASLFEAPTFGADGSIHGQARNWRHDELVAALTSLADRKMVRLDALFGMSRRTFLGDPRTRSPDEAARIERLHYALARSVCAWLDEQGKLWPFYQAWRDGWAEDPTGEKALARVMGGTPREMGGRWLAWAR